MIDAINLKNFKCFDDIPISIGGLTLFSGLNGMGKSSVFQALLLLRQSHQQGLLAARKITLNGELVSMGTAKDALYETAKDDSIVIRIILQDKRSLEWCATYTNPQSNVLNLFSAPDLQEYQTESLFGDSFQYLQAERLGPRTAFPISDYEVLQHNQLGSQGEYTAHFLNQFGRKPIPNNSLGHPAASSSNLIDQVEAWLGEICPGTRLNLTSLSDVDLVSLRYSFAGERFTSNPFRPTNVGFGLTYSLPTLVAILSLAPGGLLLVENPEAHLHSRGQVQIGELLARAAAGGVQVLVETHSDHVLNGVRLAVKTGRIHGGQVAIHYFDRSDVGQLASRVTQLHIDENGRIDRWPGGFFDEWDKTLEQLLKP
jgi:predicted ATPase